MPPMGPNFEDPVLVSPQLLKVKGKFDTHGKVIGDVIIGFLIIPVHIEEAMTDPIVDMVRLTLQPGNTTTPNAADPDVTLTSATFEKADVSNAKYNLGVGAPVRVIGLSVALKEPPIADNPADQDPPAFETFTWCVNRTVAAP